MKARLIINGKKAHLPEVHQAVNNVRQQGYPLEVRVSWEQGDIERLCVEAWQQGYDRPERRLIIGGGDGTIHEVVNSLMSYDQDKRPSIGLLPIGTANDFAKSCQLPESIEQALQFAVQGDTHWVDVVKSQHSKGCVYFINILSAGFGAQVTAQTPVGLKNLLGGGAYTLSGLVQAAQFQPFEIELDSEECHFNGKIIAGALCNGRFAGGGQELGKNAYLNDGLLQVCFLKEFPPSALTKVLTEIALYNQTGLCNGSYLVSYKCKRIK